MSSLFLDRSIPDLIDDLSSRTLTPADLLSEVERKISEWEDLTHAWVHVDLATARKMLKTDTNIFPRKLGGIPFGIKDIFNTKTLPTEMGSPLWKGFTPGNDARVVASLISAGALPVGKTVTAEFAVHSLNKTLNPHDAFRTPGTSSSGSAAAVSRGMVPFALGTQTAGSIVRPASFCGVWGMKPSFGLIPRTGVLKTTDSLDTIGFLCAHGRSLRPVLDTLRVRGPNYPFVFQNVDQKKEKNQKKSKKWKVGYVKTHTWSEARDYAKQGLAALLGQIEQNNLFQVEEVSWPNELSEAHEIHNTIYVKSLAYYFQQEANTGTKVSATMATMIENGNSVTTKTFLAALDKQNTFCKIVDFILEPYDFVISLGTSSSAPLREEKEIPDPSLIWTLCHLPVVAVPTCRCPSGMPFGIQMISKKWNDYCLLQVIEEMINLAILPKGSMDLKVS